jgi:hypothetical protein
LSVFCTWLQVSWISTISTRLIVQARKSQKLQVLQKRNTVDQKRNNQKIISSTQNTFLGVWLFFMGGIIWLFSTQKSMIHGTCMTMKTYERWEIGTMSSASARREDISQY